jgi:transcription elongation factor SPT6
MSCSAFLKIDQAFVESSARDPEDGPDVLDSTRIHSEDYDIARKMASDAEELDEEDIAALTHPSEAVKQLMDGDAHKLNDLRLDDFAVELQRLMGIPKRITLYLIREELQRPFNETRTAFRPLSDAEAFRAISGETPETFSEGLIVPVVVVAPPGKNDFMRVRLESGLEGLIDGGHMLDADQSQTIFTAGQALRALIIDAKPAQLMREKDPGNSEDDWKRYLVNLDCRPKSLEHGDAYAKRTALALRDKHYDTLQETTDAASLEAAKKKAAGRQRRLIQHPNFHNFNAGQAEHYLATQMRGDCVIRPSSLGTDYLACTWKVADGVYAHLREFVLHADIFTERITRGYRAEQARRQPACIGRLAANRRQIQVR